MDVREIVKETKSRVNLITLLVGIILGIGAALLVLEIIEMAKGKKCCPTEPPIPPPVPIINYDCPIYNNTCNVPLTYNGFCMTPPPVKGNGELCTSDCFVPEEPQVCQDGKCTGTCVGTCDNLDAETCPFIGDIIHGQFFQVSFDPFICIEFEPIDIGSTFCFDSKCLYFYPSLLVIFFFDQVSETWTPAAYDYCNALIRTDSIYNGCVSAFPASLGQFDDDYGCYFTFNCAKFDTTDCFPFIL